MTTTETESIPQDVTTLSSRQFLELIRSLPKAQALQLLREHWQLLLPKEPGIALVSMYSRLLQHH